MIPLGGESDEEMMVDINTTPLVDVLLVLLVMLIITIPIQLHSVSLEMPGTNAPPPLNEPEIVQIDVTPAGAFVWNGDTLTRADLEARLQAAAQQPDQPEIHLRPDRTAKYEQVAAVLATAQRFGLLKIGLVGSEQFAPQ
ncbi:biopolymer transporter ExbD [Caenimonas koreensis]|uniref:Biopolymer transporter ExbD n=1 Tax=Caenimonas koreensis DSM 17982 TaxID=1121255 RepID=A0A844AR44_9BURK|nr:biopolymer transporter ExbD [Caenimonas koreensis]MRD46685.1 biopolymer transporter ExbD [Caenimonas koreensis DSM 17982]